MNIRRFSDALGLTTPLTEEAKLVKLQKELKNIENRLQINYQENTRLWETINQDVRRTNNAKYNEYRGKKIYDKLKHSITYRNALKKHLAVKLAINSEHLIEEIFKDWLNFQAKLTPADSEALQNHINNIQHVINKLLPRWGLEQTGENGLSELNYDRAAPPPGIPLSPQPLSPAYPASPLAAAPVKREEAKYYDDHQPKDKKKQQKSDKFFNHGASPRWKPDHDIEPIKEKIIFELKKAEKTQIELQKQHQKNQDEQPGSPLPNGTLWNNIEQKLLNDMHEAVREQKSLAALKERTIQLLVKLSEDISGNKEITEEFETFFNSNKSNSVKKVIMEALQTEQPQLKLLVQKELENQKRAQQRKQEI